MNEQRRLLHTIEIDVRWGDMDAVGHVNNARYFTYFEGARIGWLLALGREDTVNGANEGPVIANASCSFRRAITYPARLAVSMFGGTPGRSSFESWYEIRDRGDSAVLYADGASRMVWVDRRAGRSIPLPEFIRVLLPPAADPR